MLCDQQTSYRWNVSLTRRIVRWERLLREKVPVQEFLKIHKNSDDDDDDRAIGFFSIRIETLLMVVLWIGLVRLKISLE